MKKLYHILAICARRRSSIIADAVGTFEIAGTYTLDDYAVETSGAFAIVGTYTVA